MCNKCILCGKTLKKIKNDWIGRDMHIKKCYPRVKDDIEYLLFCYEDKNVYMQQKRKLFKRKYNVEF